MTTYYRTTYRLSPRQRQRRRQRWGLFALWSLNGALFALLAATYVIQGGF